MPELPEVENIKLGLEPKVLHKKIIDITFSDVVIAAHAMGKAAVVKNVLSDFSNALLGQTITQVNRRGKYIYFKLDRGYLITHFGMTGAYFVVNELFEITNKNYQKHQHIVFELDTKEKLVFSDIRRFGELRYIDNLNNFKPFNQLAPEPFTKKASVHFLEKLASKKYANQMIKHLLLEGNVFCGCGNIYACEVLYKEKINPQTLASELSANQQKKLFKTLVATLKFSIEQGGSTISDYIHTDGGEGNMQNYLQVYGKKMCPKGHEIKNVTIKTRSTYFCPECQK